MMLSKAAAGVNSVPHQRLFTPLFLECHIIISLFCQAYFMFVFIREQ